MSTARVGCHAYIREKALPKVSAFYGVTVGKDDVFTILHIDTGYGRGCIHLENPTLLGDRRIALWRGDVAPFPRCEICEQEGHTKSRCKPEAEAR